MQSHIAEGLAVVIVYAVVGMHGALYMHPSATRREVTAVVCVHRKRHEVVEEVVGRAFDTTAIHSIQIGMIMKIIELCACLKAEIA